MIHKPVYIDRYPAKMVVRLADSLIEKYTANCTHLFDPFCGSGAILSTGKKHGLKVSGTDINPYAVLLSNVKLSGFDKKLARGLCATLIHKAKTSTNKFPVNWKFIKYWFTEATLDKFERLRYIANEMQLCETREGRAVLLALALSIRKCSRADQRSPKYFISKTAINERKGKHFSPFKEIPILLRMLANNYGVITNSTCEVKHLNFAEASNELGESRFSHIITSPPYINAQDYFRNFQLELYILEDLLPFKAEKLPSKFIGTEKVSSLDYIPKKERKLYEKFLPCLPKIYEIRPKSAAIIYKYFYDMSKSFDAIKRSLQAEGTFVLVCGDNLVAGYPIPTWAVLNDLLKEKGFIEFDRFGDQINRRILAPSRQGHKGLIKEEIISAFKLSIS